MRSTLFSHNYRYIGWPMLSFGLILGILVIFFEFEFPWMEWKMIGFGDEILLNSKEENTPKFLIRDNFTNELVALLVLIGSVFIAFSKEKVEDEFFQQLRFDAIIWALKIQSLLLLLAILFLYNVVFLQFMMVALVSFFIFYIGRYHFLLFLLKKQAS